MIFSLVVSLQKWLAYYYTAGNHIEIVKTQEKRNIFHIFYQINVSRIPLWIGQCYLCADGHVKLRLQYLYGLLRNIKSLIVLFRVQVTNNNLKSSSTYLIKKLRPFKDAHSSLSRYRRKCKSLINIFWSNDVKPFNICGVKYVYLNIKKRSTKL